MEACKVKQQLAGKEITEAGHPWHKGMQLPKFDQHLQIHDQMEMIRDKLAEISRKLVRRYIYEKAKLPCELKSEEDEVYSMIKSGAQEQEWQFVNQPFEIDLDTALLYYDQ
uniref:Uncharacterized protein n=1 Tax=Romanomermis culicivorax TaxID=13658 RepID=A0A915I272_ROMCU